MGRWLSGRKHPPAKRVGGVKLPRGFESLPSRHSGWSPLSTELQGRQVAVVWPDTHYTRRTGDSSRHESRVAGRAGDQRLQASIAQRGAHAKPERTCRARVGGLRRRLSVRHLAGAARLLPHRKPSDLPGADPQARDRFLAADRISADESGWAGRIGYHVPAGLRPASQEPELAL